MSARRHLRVVGLVPGASGIRSALNEFRSGGPGVVTALATPLLRIAADLLDPEGEIRPLPVGELVKECLARCDEEGRSGASRGLLVAALARTAEELDSDSPFAASARFPGFHKAVGHTLDELRRWGIDADAMETAAQTLVEETAAKLRSLAFLKRGAQDVLESLGMDDEQDATERLQECKPNASAKLPRVLILSGASLEPTLSKWITWLAEHTEVIVAIEQPLPAQQLFSSSGVFAAMLDAPIERRGQASGLCAALFTDGKSDSGPTVRINSCADALAEAEWALRGCLQDLNRGLHPHEIAIYARNLEEYACPLEAAAKRLGVTLKLSRRVPVLTNRFARLVLETLEFCASEDPRLIIPMLGCSYLGLDRQMASEIREQARLAYKARKNAWPVFSGWAEGKQHEVGWLANMMKWRESATKTPQTLRTWVTPLQTLIDILPMPATAVEGPTRRRDTGVRVALRRAIKNLASVRRDDGDRPIPIREFASICRAAWEDELYFVPASEMGISVVGAAQSLGEVRSVYAVGMLEGVFPRRRTEDPILTDEDRHLISQALQLNPELPNSFDQAKEERDEFYRLCAAAQDRLTLSYPQADDSRDNVPAFYLHEIERVMGEIPKHDFPRVPLAPPQEDCVDEADRRLRAALDAPREDPLSVNFLTKEVRDEFAWPAGDAFSPDDLRSALQCEFRHFASRRLHLKPNRESSRWSRLRTLPRSVRLLQQPTVESALSALETALDAELDMVYGDIPEWEYALLRSGGRRLISEWIKREFVARQLWAKDTDTIKIDSRFGDPGIRNMMPGEVLLKGTLPGVSRMGPYSVTHLYEGQAPERESVGGGMLAELDTLYYGLHLLARYEKGHPTAVEVESMSGNRTLLVLPRVAEMALASRHQEGLDVVDLSGGMDSPLGQKAFFDEVKRRLRRAVAGLQQSGIEPRAGEHCKRCGFGELCRRSYEFSEDDSPFGVDENDFEID